MATQKRLVGMQRHNPATAPTNSKMRVHAECSGSSSVAYEENFEQVRATTCTISSCLMSSRVWTRHGAPINAMTCFLSPHAGRKKTSRNLPLSEPGENVD